MVELISGSALKLWGRIERRFLVFDRSKILTAFKRQWYGWTQVNSVVRKFFDLCERGMLLGESNLALRKENRMDNRIAHRPEENVVYTKYITLRNGKRLYAAAYGLEAFRFVVQSKKRRLE